MLRASWPHLFQRGDAEERRFLRFWRKGVHCSWHCRVSSLIITALRGAVIMEDAEAEHFRELSVLGKRTGAAIGLCKSRHEVTGRRRRRKWQRGTRLGAMKNEEWRMKNSSIINCQSSIIHYTLYIIHYTFLKCQASLRAERSIIHYALYIIHLPDGLCVIRRARSTALCPSCASPYSRESVNS